MMFYPTKNHFHRLQYDEEFVSLGFHRSIQHDTHQNTCHVSIFRDNRRSPRCIEKMHEWRKQHPFLLEEDALLNTTGKLDGIYPVLRSVN